MRIDVIICLLIGLGAVSATRYSLEQSNKTCIIIDSNIEFKQSNVIKEFDKASTIDGLCGSSSSQLTLEFDESNATLVFNFALINGSKVNLKNVSLTFGNYTGSYDKATQLSTIGQSYSCKSEWKIQLGSGDNFVIMRNTKLQAFGIEGGKLSDNATVCQQDKETTTTALAPTTSSSQTTETEAKTTPTEATETSTTAAPTTSVDKSTTSNPSTTPEPEAPLLNLTVKGAGGIVCVLAQMRARFFISYRTKDEEKKADVPLSTLTFVNGSCGNATQELLVGFNGNWTVRMRFVGESDKYRLGGIAFDFTEDPRYFPQTINPGRRRTVEGNSTYLEVNSGAYFTCEAKKSFQLDANVTMETQELKVEAFRTSNSTDKFQGSQTKCDADLPVDNIVPIIVGAALAALVIIVLVAYIIGRRRQSGGGYQSV